VNHTEKCLDLVGRMRPAELAVTCGPVTQTRLLARRLGLEKYMSPAPRVLSIAARARLERERSAAAVDRRRAGVAGRGLKGTLTGAEPAALEHAAVAGGQAQGQLGTHGTLGADLLEHGGEGRIGKEG